MLDLPPVEALGVVLGLLLEVHDLFVDCGDLGLEVTDLLESRLDRGRRAVAVHLDETLLEIVDLRERRATVIRAEHKGTVARQ